MADHQLQVRRRLIAQRHVLEAHLGAAEVGLGHIAEAIPQLALGAEIEAADLRAGGAGPLVVIVDQGVELRPAAHLRAFDARRGGLGDLGGLRRRRGGLNLGLRRPGRLLRRRRGKAFGRRRPFEPQEPRLQLPDARLLRFQPRGEVRRNFGLRGGRLGQKGGGARQEQDGGAAGTADHSSLY